MTIDDFGTFYSSLNYLCPLSVVAEGVETPRELQLMRARCDRVQGHLYRRSANPDAAREPLARPGRMFPI